MPRACPVELLTMPRACPVELQRCHGLAPWSFNDATGLPRGVLTLEATLAANVNLHGARPWHPSVVIFCFASSKRETPRDKPVASRFEPDKPVASRFEPDKPVASRFEPDKPVASIRTLQGRGLLRLLPEAKSKRRHRPHDGDALERVLSGTP
jgi:hypothetical protein